MVNNMLNYPVRGGESSVEVHEIIKEVVRGGQNDEVITVIHQIPSRDAQWAPMPDWVRPELVEAYRAKGIDQLYSHQSDAADRVRRGDNVVIVTPTASGKTL
jgi:ATP-dependent helicase YprA (DUF1998 family)